MTSRAASTILLDTHVFLWMQTDPDRLGSARAMVEDSDLQLLLSAASSWEISIKWMLGKLPLPVPPDRYVPDRMQRSAIGALPILHSHALAVGGLPAHHNDPFDRILVAQARTEGFRLATADAALADYDVELLRIP